MSLIAYARVFTDEQTTVPQTDVLEPRLLQYLSTSGECIAVLGERAGSAGSGTRPAVSLHLTAGSFLQQGGRPGTAAPDGFGSHGPGEESGWCSWIRRGMIRP